jgi:hypothetical protein
MPHPIRESLRMPPVCTPSIRLWDDQTLIVVGLGGFGRYVLQILSQEFARLQIPKERVFCLTFDSDHSTNERASAPDTEAQLLDPFDCEVYLSSRENTGLRESVSHLPASALRDVGNGCKGLPAIGLVTFHRYDELFITRRMLSVIDEARAVNPGGKVKCIVVASMSGGFANGVAVPMLFRIRDHLKHKKVRLELFLATSEGHRDAPHVAVEKAERNCVASAMLWEQVMLGERELVYPGKEGVREDRRFRGPLQQRTWIFSGGAGNTTYSYQAVASIVANCIATLETTRLGSYLDGDRVHYAEDILERMWAGRNGGKHPTALLAMNVGGLKLDALPTILHLRAARRFIDAVTGSLSEERELHVADAARRCLHEAHVTDDGVVQELEIGKDPLGAEEIRNAGLPQDKMYAYVSGRLDEDLVGLFEMGEGTRRPTRMGTFIEAAQAALRQRAGQVANGDEGYLSGGVRFYQTLLRELGDRRASAQARYTAARAELAASSERQRLDGLLARLRRDTVLEGGHRPNIVERFVATITVSASTQMRKILEVASGLRGMAMALASSRGQMYVYDALIHYCEQEREALQGRAYVLNAAGALCARQEELIQRVSRSAFTYQKARFEPLIARLWQRVEQQLELPSVAATIAALGGDLARIELDEERALEHILTSCRPDPRLDAILDEVMASEPLVRDALEESLSQFFPTIQVDRDRFPTLETARARFVLCTPRIYEAYRDDLFVGYHHLETSNPCNILVSGHEEGIPFLALNYVYRIHEEYKAHRGHERTTLAHSMARYAGELPLLDD